MTHPDKPRILSLLPSATEIICALGLEEQLIGISHSCDYPESITSLPILTESVVDPTLPSGEIDRLTKEALHSGESLYRLDAARFAEMRPEIVVTQALCDVCAISYTTVEKAARTLDPPAELVSLEPGCIEDIFSDILRVAEVTGTKAKGQELVRAARARLEALQEKLRPLREAPGYLPPKVLTLEWFEPAFYGGHWVVEQVEAAGGRVAFGRPHARSEGIDWESIAESDPDVIVCMPCGYDTCATRKLLEPLEGHPVFRSLRAVQQGNVYCVDANAFFSRPSPRVVIGAEVLAHLLHPELIDLPSESAPPIRVRL